MAQYYELLDTLLRVLKAQPLTLLHVFHHAVVLVMAYGVRARRPRACGGCPALTRARRTQWLEYAQSLQVIALLANTGVHVVMCAPMQLARTHARTDPLLTPCRAGTPTTSCAPWGCGRAARSRLR